MGVRPLDMMGDDAMKKGFLSKAFGNSVIKRVNRIFRAVHLPPWLKGDAHFLETENVVELDLSNVKQVGGGVGTHANPHVMDWNAEAYEPYDDTWSIEAPPAGTDGVEWNGSRVVSVYDGLNLIQDSGGDYPQDSVRELYQYNRTMTFSSTGQLVAISAETRNLVRKFISPNAA